MKQIRDELKKDGVDPSAGLLHVRPTGALVTALALPLIAAAALVGYQ